MDRRTLITQAGLGAVGAMASTAFIKDAVAATDPRQDVIDTTSECIKRAESCVAHCADMFAMGNTSMAACNKSVHNMLATCNAMLKLASYESDLAAKIADACIAACEACAKECGKHAKMKICKACGDACEACAKACKRAYK